jgi:hypothetical protein
LGEILPGVEPQVMAGVTTQFVGELLELCGRIRSGEVARDGDAWQRLLDGAMRRLHRPGTG